MNYLSLLLNPHLYEDIQGTKAIRIQNILMTLGLAALKNTDLHSISGCKFSYMVELASKEYEKLLSDGYVYQMGYYVYLTDKGQSALADMPSVVSNSYEAYLLPHRAINRGIKYELSYVSDVRQPRRVTRVLNKLSKMKWLVEKEDCAINPRIKENNSLYEYESELFKTLASKQSEVRIPHFFDKRGRFYSDSYGLNYQGDEWSKASISPKYLRPVDKSAMKWLIYDIANHYGLDKKTNAEKLGWFRYVRRNRYAILIAASRGLGDLYKSADKPLLFKKAVRAYLNAERGEAVNHFISLDATASGIQILAMMSGDTKLAKLTNLVDYRNNYDIYEVAGREVAKLMGIAYSKAVRKPVKKALMTYYYNSMKGLEEQAMNLNKLDGVVNRISSSQLKAIIDGIAKGGTMVKDSINQLFDRLPKTTKVIRFTMPDGFIVELPLIAKSMKKFRVNYREINFMFDTNAYDYNNNWRGLVPNIIHAIDSYIAREMVRRAKFPIFIVHDCFNCHPNNAEEMKRNMYEILRELSNMDLYNFITKQIAENAGIEHKHIKFEGAENIIVSPKAYYIC